MSNSQTVSASYLRGSSEDLGKGFWQQWQQYRDYLHRCCIKWMGGNPTDAEEALSRAMLKAREKVQKFAGKINNFKAWLTTLTRNLCVDIYRERSRGANRVEDIEGYASSEEQGLLRSEDTPEIALETGEKRIVIRRAIDNLPTRLRETFILHFYQELSYPEIAQQQEISYQNVCKRISQARAILREELRGYFIEEEATDKDKSVSSTATESAIGEISEGNAGVEAIVGETVTLSVAVEEVESVGDSEFLSSSQFSIPSLKSVGDENEGNFLRCETCSNQPCPSVPFAPLIDVRLQFGKRLQLVRLLVEASEVYGRGWPQVRDQVTRQHIGGLIALCFADTQGAIQALESAETSESDKAFHWLALGRVHMGRENAEAASRGFDAVLSLMQDDIVAVSNSKDASRAVGNVREVQRWLCGVRELAPDDFQVVKQPKDIESG
jgi:RNA polymerase sigma factor (sigma-70 family)